MKADFDVDKKTPKSWKGEGQAFIPFLKLHLYFTEATEDIDLYFLFF